MSNASQRVIFRWIHIVFGLMILAYIYSPQQEVQQYVSVYRFVIIPVLTLSGLWLWKGHALRRMASPMTSDRDR